LDIRERRPEKDRENYTRKNFITCTVERYYDNQIKED
jgi:hypothetical protein